MSGSTPRVRAIKEYAGEAFLGNPELRISHIENTDLRWEWFRRPGQLFAVSGFKKEIVDPIERVSYTVAGESTFIQPVNYDRGEVRGAEVEVRTGLGMLADWLDGLSIGGNYTAIDSQVDVPIEEQENLDNRFGLGEPDRRLQGQPEYLLNANVTYDNPRVGTSVGVFFTKVGETLLTGAAVGTDGTPDVYSAPFGDLNVKVSQRILRHVSISLAAKNLLRENLESFYRTPDGRQTTKTSHETAMRVGLVLKAEW